MAAESSPEKERERPGQTREETQQRRSARTGSQAVWVQIPATPLSGRVDIGVSPSSLCHSIPIFNMEIVRITILISTGSCEH